MKLRKAKVLPLNRVDVTRYPIGHMIYSWLFSHGYRTKIYGERIYLVRGV